MSKTKYDTDQELLTAIRNEEDEALQLVYKMHFPMILHFILQNNGTEPEAKDVYQEAVIVLYENAADPAFELTCKIKTYIYSVCRRLWLKKLAEKSRFIGKIDDYESFVVFDKSETADADEREKQFDLMQASLHKLGEPCRTILEDFFIHDFSMQQITDKMGYTNTDNAKNQKYKCLVRLKKLFFAEYKF